MGGGNKTIARPFPSNITIFSKILVLPLVILILSAASYAAPSRFGFENNNPLKEWKEKRYRGKVTYTIKTEGGNSFVYAESRNAASALYKKIRFSPRKTPLISWRWRVSRFPEKSGKGYIKEDDYAARVYVIFTSWFFPASKCIEYIFDEDIKENTVLPNPYSKNIKLYIIRSGRDKLGRWFREERDIYADYLNLFGRRPRLEVGAIAFMVDTDHTKSYARASFDDFVIGYKKGGGER